MKIIIKDNPSQLGEAAGQMASRAIRRVIEEKGHAYIVLATGTSQFEILNHLIKEKIDWTRVSMFHLDEYIDLPESSPASFRRYLKERFIQRVTPLNEIHLIDGEGDPVKECRRLSDIIKKMPIDLTLVGIGENGHLGFNDPPADFETDEPFIIVKLDEKCRGQQFGEGWFKSIDDVPGYAITMSIKQIMKSGQIICSAPESRKATAIRDCFDNGVSNLHPASILKEHTNCICFLDKSSSALLRNMDTEWNGDLGNQD